MGKFNATTILYLYPRLSPLEDFENILALGGAQRIFYQLAIHFRNSGATVIVASDDPEQSLIIRSLTRAGVKCIRVPFRRKSPLSIIIALEKLFMVIRNSNIDFIHSHHRLTTVFAYYFSRLFGIPLVHNAHVTFADKRYFRIFAGDYIIAISEGVKKNLINYFNIDPKKIAVIHNGVEIARPDEAKMKSLIALQNLAGKRIVSVIGRITEQKGHRYLIEALPPVIKLFPTLQVFLVGGEVAGERGLKKFLQSRAETLGIDNNIIFVGHQEDVASFIGISEFTVLPSIQEGMGNVIVESKLLGKPVIATRIDGPSEIINDGVDGILVEAKNSPQLAEEIIYMLSHEEEAKKMGERGKRSAGKKFDVTVMLDKYSEYYVSLLTAGVHKFREKRKHRGRT